MASFLKVSALFAVVLALTASPSQEAPLERAVRRYEEDPGLVKKAALAPTANVTSTWIWIDEADIARGISYLKQKYPNADWDNADFSLLGSHTTTPKTR